MSTRKFLGLKHSFSLRLFIEMSLSTFQSKCEVVELGSSPRPAISTSFYKFFLCFYI